MNQINFIIVTLKIKELMLTNIEVTDNNMFILNTSWDGKKIILSKSIPLESNAILN